MTTMPIFSSTVARRRTPLQTARDGARWVRETPAPRWEGDARHKATFFGYVFASMFAWTLVGLSFSVVLGQVLDAVS